MVTDYDVWYMFAHRAMPPSWIDVMMGLPYGTAHSVIVHRIWPKLGRKGARFDSFGGVVMGLD